MDVARLEGPLQDDAVLAIGRIGDKRGLTVLAELQQSAPRTLQPSIAAAICLLGSNCGSHVSYLRETLKFALATPVTRNCCAPPRAGSRRWPSPAQECRRGAVRARRAVARPRARGHRAGARYGRAAEHAVLLEVLEAQDDLAPAIELLREAFDMLEEDFEEERFFVAVRRAYWAAPAGSRAGTIADTLIQRLEF